MIKVLLRPIGLKTPISADTFLDQLTLEGSGTPKLEISSFSTSSLKSIGYNEPNELCPAPVASKMFDLTSSYFCFAGGHPKMPKNVFRCDSIS